jgi:BirA family biotin operon repressor/biotin-[acetyl-CoA-carboxylase] ligase
MVKELILQKLKENDLSFVSGELLSQLAGVSRTAIWKSIQQLRNEGYIIESSPNKGYKLSLIPDILNPNEITYKLNTKLIGRAVKCFEVLDSTNVYAKKAAAEGCIDGTVITAETQTAGRGRLGRDWYSPGGLGIWLSIVLRPSISPEHVQLITLAASVAVVNALKAATGIQTGIKWPNDIILDGRKVCGILTEMSCEADSINYAVIGIGLNVNQKSQDFSGELTDKATSLTIHSGEKTLYNRLKIVRNLLYEFERAYLNINEYKIADILKEWKKYSVTIGKEVRIISKDRQFTGIAEDLTEDGRLVVISSDGEKKEILSGEISVRGIMGYTGGKQ